MTQAPDCEIKLVSMLDSHIFDHMFISMNQFSNPVQMTIYHWLKLNPSLSWHEAKWKGFLLPNNLLPMLPMIFEIAKVLL